MNKTRYTLTEADMYMLADFQKADSAFFAAQKALNKAICEDPDYRVVVDQYKNAYQDRLNKASLFAQCVALEVMKVSSAPVTPDMTEDERLKLETAEGAI